jgi:hypothetical protein
MKKKFLDIMNKTIAVDHDNIDFYNSDINKAANEMEQLYNHRVCKNCGYMMKVTVNEYVYPRCLKYGETINPSLLDIKTCLNWEE